MSCNALRFSEDDRRFIESKAAHSCPGCPRHVHSMSLASISDYVPELGCDPPVPAWKQMDAFEEQPSSPERRGRYLAVAPVRALRPSADSATFALPGSR